MDFTKNILIKLLITVVVCWYLVSSTLGFSSKPKKIYHNSIFEIQTNNKHKFPVDSDGNIMTVGDLSTKEQKILLEKIIKKNPYTVAQMAIKNKTKKFFGVIDYGEFTVAGIPCFNPQENSANLILVLGDGPAGGYSAEIRHAWNRFGWVYNNALLDAVRDGDLPEYSGLNRCLYTKGLD